jgi:FdrA protein
MTLLKELFQQPVHVVNVGLPSFAEELQNQGVTVQTVDWRPPAGGNKKVADLLEKIRRSQEPFLKSGKGE